MFAKVLMKTGRPSQIKISVSGESDLSLPKAKWRSQSFHKHILNPKATKIEIVEPAKSTAG